jgi:hypothetical protein
MVVPTVIASNRKKIHLNDIDFTVGQLDPSYSPAARNKKCHNTSSPFALARDSLKIACLRIGMGA